MNTVIADGKFAKGRNKFYVVCHKVMYMVLRGLFNNDGML